MAFSEVIEVVDLREGDCLNFSPGAFVEVENVDVCSAEVLVSLAGLFYPVTIHKDSTVRVRSPRSHPGRDESSHERYEVAARGNGEWVEESEAPGFLRRRGRSDGS